MKVVKITEDKGFCELPADILMIGSTDTDHTAYIETKNLDGETNLKNKCVPKDLWNTFDHPREGI